MPPPDIATQLTRLRTIGVCHRTVLTQWLWRDLSPPVHGTLLSLLAEFDLVRPLHGTGGFCGGAPTTDDDVLVPAVFIALQNATAKRLPACASRRVVFELSQPFSFGYRSRAIAALTRLAATWQRGRATPSEFETADDVSFYMEADSPWNYVGKFVQLTALAGAVEPGAGTEVAELFISSRDKLTISMSYRVGTVVDESTGTAT